MEFENPMTLTTSLDSSKSQFSFNSTNQSSKASTRMHCLLISHSISHLFHAIASIFLFFAWKTIDGECQEITKFIANLHAVLATFYGLIASGKLATVIAHYFGKKMSTKITSVICAILSAKVYCMAMLAEAVLELATFSRICNLSQEYYKHLWLSRAFFAVSLVLNAIFLALSVFFHPSHEKERKNI